VGGARIRESALTQVVGISEMCTSGSAEDVIVTYSLGSCIGLTLYDPVERVGGLLHSMLPLAQVDPKRAAMHPCMFVDSGVSLMLQTLFDMGAKRKNLVACVAGAAHQLDRRDLFRIGERNYMVLRKLLWKNDILITAEDVGGEESRTMWLDMSSGETLLRVFGRTWLLDRTDGKGVSR